MQVWSDEFFLNMTESSSNPIPYRWLSETAVVVVLFIAVNILSARLSSLCSLLLERLTIGRIYFCLSRIYWL